MNNRNEQFYQIQIFEVSWITSQQRLRDIRTRVFIEEQGVPEEMEWDQHDDKAIHLLAINEMNAHLGCARILANGIIGRMAVLKESRTTGIGRKLLENAILICQRKEWSSITLSAQLHAIPFYEKFGFEVCSEPYMDAGIVHRDMHLLIC